MKNLFHKSTTIKAKLLYKERIDALKKQVFISDENSKGVINSKDVQEIGNLIGSKAKVQDILNKIESINLEKNDLNATLAAVLLNMIAGMKEYPQEIIGETIWNHESENGHMMLFARDIEGYEKYPNYEQGEENNNEFKRKQIKAIEKYVQSIVDDPETKFPLFVSLMIDNLPLIKHYEAEDGKTEEGFHSGEEGYFFPNKDVKINEALKISERLRGAMANGTMRNPELVDFYREYLKKHGLL